MRCIRRKSSSEDNDDIFVMVDDDAPSLAENELFVQVKACGLSLVNTKMIKEVFRKSPSEALCVGHDVSGVVKSVGSRVTTLKEGDEIVGILPLDSVSSGCGELCIFKEFDVVKKPCGVSHENAAAAIGDAVRAYTALHYHTHVCAGDTVLIMDGATSSGSLAIQLAQLWGAKVMSTYSTLPEKQFLESFHPTLAQILELSQRSTLLVSSIMEETGGVGVDCIIDNGVRLFSNEEDIAMLAEKSNYPKPHKVDILSCLGFAGKWVTSHPDLQLDPPDCQQLFLRNSSVSFLFPPAWTLMHAQHGRYQHILHDIMEKMDKGVLRCKIAQTVSLEEAADVLKGLDDIRVGKTHVIVNIYMNEMSDEINTLKVVKLQHYWNKKQLWMRLRHIMLTDPTQGFPGGSTTYQETSGGPLACLQTEVHQICYVPIPKSHHHQGVVEGKMQ